MKICLKVAVVLLGAILPCFSQDNLVEKEKDWLEYYYENPTPERFVEEIRGFASEGLLTNDQVRPALIGFMCRVIRENKAKLGEWYEALSGLTGAQIQTLHTAMLFSRTEEADKILEAKFGQKYREEKVETPEILKMPLDRMHTLDLLWGYYYATGSSSPIRRMILAFRFEDAPDRPEGVDIPEGHRAFYKELPAEVADMLISNAQRHPKLKEILVEIYEKDDSLMPVEKTWLYTVLSELDPKSYPPKPAPESKV